MIHFIISIFYLVLILLLVLGYIFSFTIIMRYLIQVFRGLRHWQWSKKTFYPTVKTCFLSKSTLVKLVIACFLLTTGLYIYERNRWITPNSAHREAKQYLVTGMVLMDFRTLGFGFIYPERLIWKPSVWLQQVISYTGRKLIPENDAEHAVWEYHFVLAPYINRIHAPHNEAVYPLIDASEFVLETLATKEMADVDLRTKNKYIIYPLVALYYQYSYMGMYFVKPGERCYTEGLYKDREQYEYLQQVVDWTVRLENEWLEQPAVMEYMEKNPDIHLVQLASTALLLHDILYYQIHNLEFTCEDRYLDLYYEYIEKYLADESPYHRVDRQLQKRFDPPVLYHGVRVNFFGHRLCDRPKLPAYNIRTAVALSSEGAGWYEAFKALNKKLVPREKQEENMNKRDPWK